MNAIPLKDEVIEITPEEREELKRIVSEVIRKGGSFRGHVSFWINDISKKADKVLREDFGHVGGFKASKIGDMSNSFKFEVSGLRKAGSTRKERLEKARQHSPKIMPIVEEEAVGEMSFGERIIALERRKANALKIANPRDRQCALDEIAKAKTKIDGEIEQVRMDKYAREHLQKPVQPKLPEITVQKRVVNEIRTIGRKPGERIAVPSLLSSNAYPRVLLSNEPFLKLKASQIEVLRRLHSGGKDAATSAEKTGLRGVGLNIPAEKRGRKPKLR